MKLPFRLSDSDGKNEKFRTFLSDRSGLAATEFAILAPALTIGLIMVIDVGLAVHESMQLDQSLRAGAEFALSNVEDTEMLEKMIVATASGDFAETETGQSGQEGARQSPYTARAEAYYFCPEAPGVEVPQDFSNCNNNTIPLKAYNLELAQRFKPIFISELNLKSTLSVQAP